MLSEIVDFKIDFLTSGDQDTRHKPLFYIFKKICDQNKKYNHTNQLE